MSAFLCDTYHISKLAEYACRRPCSAIWHNGRRYDLHDARTIADILYQENCRSLNARYGDTEFDPFVFDRAAYVPYHYTPAQIIKACHCFVYQACETDDYYTTVAHAIIEHIIGRACRSLPGYDVAEWGLSVPAHARHHQHIWTEGARRR